MQSYEFNVFSFCKKGMNAPADKTNEVLYKTLVQNLSLDLNSQKQEKEKTINRYNKKIQILNSKELKTEVFINTHNDQ